MQSELPRETQNGSSCYPVLRQHHLSDSGSTDPESHPLLIYLGCNAAATKIITAGGPDETDQAERGARHN